MNKLMEGMTGMNITLSADMDTLRRTRDYAKQHGTSLNQLVRDFLRNLTTKDEADKVADEFVRNAMAHSGRSPKGFRFSREDAQRMRD
jgi:hypothetical protein